MLLDIYVGGASFRSRCPTNPHPIEARCPRAGGLASEEALKGTRPKARRVIEQKACQGAELVARGVEQLASLIK
jgi:hypothetical protein